MLTEDLSPTQDEPLMRKRLLFRSQHRGCKEMDLLLGPFAERALPAMDAAALARYAELLEEDDADLWRWATEPEATPEKYQVLMREVCGG